MMTLEYMAQSLVHNLWQHLNHAILATWSSQYMARGTMNYSILSPLYVDSAYDWLRSLYR
jgi:hypothetical protein